MFTIIVYSLTNCPLTIDGVTIYKSHIRKHRQIVFEGKLDILEESSSKHKKWFEPFLVTVTDKRITKQGIWIRIEVGDYFGEGDLLKI